MLGTTIVAVAKVIAAVCISAFATHRIPNASVIVQDFSFMIANVLLPSLTFYSIAVSVDMELLMRSSILVAFSLLFLCVGGLCGYFASKVLFRVRGTGIPSELRHSLRFELGYRTADGQEMDYHLSRRAGREASLLTPVAYIVVGGGLEAHRVEADGVIPLIEPPAIDYVEQPFYHYATLLACSAHNSVTLPLSLLHALSNSLEWINLALGTSYISVYSIVMSVFVWGAGPFLVARSKKESEKRKKIRELVALHCKLQMSRDVSTQTEVRGMDSSTTPSPVVCKAHDAVLTREETYDSAQAETSRQVDLDASRHLNTGGGALQREDRPERLGTNGSAGLIMVPESCETFIYNWRERGIVRVVYARDFEDEAMRANKDHYSVMNCLHSVKNIVKHLLTTLAFTSIIAGLVVGVIPPLRWLFFEGPFTMVTDSIAFVSRGSIPASLLLLGANLALSQSLKAVGTDNDGVRLREAEQNTDFPLDDDRDGPAYASEYNARLEEMEFDEHVSFTLSGLQQKHIEAMTRPRPLESQGGNGDQSAAVAIDAMTREQGKKKASPLDLLKLVFSLGGARQSFVFGVIIIRLLIIPAVGFILVLSLRSVLPSLFPGGAHDLLLLVLLGEIGSPSAINIAILYNAQQFMAPVWTKMLFFQYVSCTLSLVLWITLSLQIAS